MTAPDGARLTDLGDRWVDIAEVVSVQIEDAHLATGKAARIGLRNGQVHVVRIPNTSTEGLGKVTHAKAREETRLWLLNHLGGDLLEGVDYGRTSS